MRNFKFTTKPAIALSTMLVAVIFLCGCSSDLDLKDGKAHFVPFSSQWMIKTDSTLIIFDRDKPQEATIIDLSKKRVVKK